MSLLISRNGKIQDFTKPSQANGRAKKVNSVHNDLDNKPHFEDVLEKERGSEKENPPSKHSDRQMGQIQSYVNQKKQSLKYNRILHARDACSSPVVTLNPSDRIEEALRLMEKYQFHHIPLLNEEGAICGIVSDRDLLGQRQSDRLERHMSTNVLIAKDTTEVKIIAKMMLENEISALPLINENEHLVGIITKSDLLECLVRSLPLEQYV